MTEKTKDENAPAVSGSRQERIVMQTVTVIVDAWMTDDYQWDQPLSVWQVYPGQELPKQSDGTKRYRVQFQIPKTLRPVDGDVEKVTVQSA